MAYKNTVPDSDTVWYLDTGASNHMCGHKHLFMEMQEIEDGHVSFGDTSKVQVKGRGKICFSQKDGKKGSIEDVYYVPDLKSNILSIGQLMEKGYSVFMKDRMLHLKDKKGGLLAHVEMDKNRMFKLNLRNVRERCLQVNLEDLAQQKQMFEIECEILNEKRATPEAEFKRVNEEKASLKQEREDMLRAQGVLENAEEERNKLAVPEREMVDEKKEDLVKEAERLENERRVMTQHLREEHESFNREKEELRVQMKRNTESLTHERDNFMRNMQAEHARWLSRMEEKHADFKRDMELQKIELQESVNSIREEVESYLKEKKIELVHVKSEDQAADMFTKPLPTVLLDKCKMAVGMKDGRDLSLNLLLCGK